MSHADKKSSLFGKPKASNAASSSASSTAKTSVTSTVSTPIVKPPSKTAGLTISTVAVAPAMSSAARLKKIEEAKEHSELGMKSLKTSVFQWSPDHLAAAPQFEASSNAYKTAGELKLARLMMLQSADSHEGSKCLGVAALTCVKAALIGHSMGRSDLASADYQRSAELWGINGELDKCAEMLSKAAKELEEDEPCAALDLHKRACDMLCPAKTPVKQMASLHPKTIEILREAMSFMMKHVEHNSDPNVPNTLKDGNALKYAELQAALYLAFEMDSAMCKALCSITMIQLASGDFVSADQTFLQHLSDHKYILSQECRLAESFLMAMKNRDIDMLDKAKTDTVLNYLDRGVQHMAKRLSVFATQKESKAEFQVRKSADKLAKDMEELMAMAPPVQNDKRDDKVVKGKLQGGEREKERAEENDEGEEEGDEVERGGAGMEWEGDEVRDHKNKQEDEEEEEDRGSKGGRGGRANEVQHTSQSKVTHTASVNRREEEEAYDEEEVDLS